MKEVEALIQMFENSSLTELKIKDKDFSIELIRTCGRNSCHGAR